MRKTREEKAITLIALIITIVVLLILAVVAINAVTGDGIIQHASNAKTEYEKAQSEEESILSYYGEYLDNKGNMGPWRQEGNILINEDGSKVTIGTIVEYDCYTNVADTDKIHEVEKARSGVEAKQTFQVQESDSTREWKVLGIENGHILLVSTSNVGRYSMYGKIGYQYGVEELDAIGSIYGHGYGAQGARSIKIEDINKITGYDPNNPGDGVKYGTGEIWEYGNKVKYIKGENGVIIGESKNELEPEFWSQTLTFLDGDIWRELKNGEERNFTCENYGYYPTTLTLNPNDPNKGISSTSEEFKMLFEGTNVETNYYWLSSKGIGTGGQVSYFLRYVWGEHTGTKILFSSAGDEKTVHENGIRVVVKLQSGAELGNNDEDSNIEIIDVK